MSVSLYLAGAVDFNEKSYYDIIEGLIEDKVPVILFKPGMAFKVKGEVDPKYLVDINKEAMLRADIVVFYLNASRTCGMWVESVWALSADKRVIFYVEPGVRQSLYMRWIAQQANTKWITDIKELGKTLNEWISVIASNERLVDITEEFTLGDSLNLMGGAVE